MRSGFSSVWAAVTRLLPGGRSGMGQKIIVRNCLKNNSYSTENKKYRKILCKSFGNVKYLRSGVINRGLFEMSTEGILQGGPLSPLLSNIMLNELDKELERRGLPFVRYADDAMIFCKSKRAAHRVRESITRFIEGKLFLKVNREKTVVSYVRGVKFLGYSFYVMRGQCFLTVHPTYKSKMKSKLKELTSCSNGWGLCRNSVLRCSLCFLDCISLKIFPKYSLVRR